MLLYMEWESYGFMHVQISKKKRVKLKVGGMYDEFIDANFPLA